MKDYKSEIISRAKIVGIDLNLKQLDFLNELVNERIIDGVHVFDALDYAYFYIKSNYLNKNSEQIWNKKGE